MSEAAVVSTFYKSTKSTWATWVGLCISLFSMVIVRQGFRAISPEPGTALVLTREACMFGCAGVLIWLIRRREMLPLRSVGIGTSPLWKSLLWGVVIAVACIGPAVAISKFTGYGHNAPSVSFSKLPIWVIFVVVARAGVVEELFYRGYSIERMEMLGFGRVASSFIPLGVFTAAHVTGGFANTMIALVLGAILTAFYQLRRDLVSNMFGHFLLDFVSNI